jgi:ABC-type antimicrobial peptide transport system permease subunit
MCVRNLVKRKLRTFLTMLGVIIGTAALILTISMGLANEARFARIVEDWDMDLTVIDVSFSGGWVVGPDGNWTQSGEAPPLNDAAITRFEAIDGVRIASPLMQGQLHFRSGPYTMSVWSINGVRPGVLALMGYDLQAGRFPTEDDELWAVFGSMAELNFAIMEVQTSGNMSWVGASSNRLGLVWQGYEPHEIEIYVDIFNDTINFSYDWDFIWGGLFATDMEEAFRPVRSFPLNVVGQLEHSGSWNVDEGIFMDIETLQWLAALQQESQREQSAEWGWFSAIREEPREDYDRAMVRVNSVDDTSRVAAEIVAMGFHAWYPGADIIRRQEQQQGTMALLIGIAAVSIFVAAISIANTMIMSVYERTREIGVMKVIGGSIADIRKMFLLEAALIGLMGGIFGVAISLGASYAINNMELTFLEGLNMMPTGEDDVTSLITPWLMGVALGFASLIGLISGYFPARRATKLSALAAIRTD